jgi:hypothetical protein
MAWSSRSLAGVACLLGAPLGLIAPAACSGSSSGSARPSGTAGDAAAGSPGGGADSADGHAATSATGGEVTSAGTAAAGVAAGGASGAPSGGSAAEGGQAPGGSGGVPAQGGEAGVGDVGEGGGCGFRVELQTLEPGLHVTTCSSIAYGSNPPSSGQHYGTWADFGVYDFALPRGFWVHNLEHGAVVVSYHCPAGCADEVASAKAWLAGLSADQTCPAGPPRVLLLPDPRLDVAWAASAWGITLRADCFDEAAFSDFYAKRAGNALAPEAAICTSGADLRAPGAETCGANP